MCCRESVTVLLFGVTVFAVVAVMVTVAVIAVARVAVVRELLVCAVEEYREVGETAFFIPFLDVGEESPVEHMRPHHKQCHLGIARYDGGIGHNLDGGTVDEHVVILLPEGLDELWKPRVEKQLCGVWRDGADGNHVELVKMAYHLVIVLYLAREIVGDTRVGRADIF